jgi:hypothetical protein
MAVALTEPRYAYNRFAALGLYFAVTAMDRVGNESEPTQATNQASMLARQRLHLDANGHVLGLIDRPVPTPDRAKVAKQRAKARKKAAKAKRKKR